MYPRTVMAVTSSQTSQQHKYFIKLPSVYHSKPRLPRSLLSFPRRSFVWSHHHSFTSLHSQCPILYSSLLPFSPIYIPIIFLSFSPHLLSFPFFSSPLFFSSPPPSIFIPYGYKNLMTVRSCGRREMEGGGKTRENTGK